MVASLTNLRFLGVVENIKLISMAINDFRSVLNVVQKHQPDEIYNLAADFVGLSEQPVEAIERAESTRDTKYSLNPSALLGAKLVLLTAVQANVLVTLDKTS